MEHIAPSLLPLAEHARDLQHLYVDSLADLQVLLETYPDLRPLLKCTDDFQRDLRSKLIRKELTQRVLFEADLKHTFAKRVAALPGILLTANGINAVLGKRGSGKTTFALVQVLDAYLEYFRDLILSFLKYDARGKEAFDELTKQIIVVFGFREVLSVQRLDQMLAERAKRFVETYLKNVSGLSQGDLFRSQEALSAFLSNQIYFCFTESAFEFKQKLAELSQLKKDPQSQQPFAVILDDPGFIFNAIDSTVIKSEIRFVGRHCAQLVIGLETIVVLVDSFKYFYEDKYDLLSCFLPSLLYSTCSDCFVTSVEDKRYYKLAQVKNSKSLLPHQ